MESLPMLQDGEFDIVIHPVSTCYIPNVALFLVRWPGSHDQGGFISASTSSPLACRPLLILTREVATRLKTLIIEQIPFRVPIPKAETLSDYGKRVRSNLFTAGSSSLVVFAGPDL